MVQSGGGADFNPTILGDSWGVKGDNVVYAYSEELEGTNTARTELWLISSGSDIELRVSGFWNGDPLYSEAEWYNPDHVSQGAPDTDRTPGTTVFQLGDRSGVTVNLYTVPGGDSGGTQNLDWDKIGSFTDDDKSTFFNPTDSTDYGYRLTALATATYPDPAGAEALQITFRKAGYNDFTITMECNSDAFYDEP